MPSGATIPNEPPPPYTYDAPKPKSRSGISPLQRRSMEDEARPLPAGWIRQYDTAENHQFFVDTNADPPRSIWHHPEDDEQYLSSLPPTERERIGKIHRQVTPRDHEVESDHEGGGPSSGRAGAAASTSDTTHHESAEQPATGARKYAYKLKDKVTHSTHATRQAERETKRKQREEEERRWYEEQQAIRRAMTKAMETGEPQLLGKDRQGRDVYVEPPPMGFGGFRGGGGYGGGLGGGYGGGGIGYNPYMQNVYGNPSGRYPRPNVPYGRPMGYGYGGGLGLPIAGGLLGGALLGGLLF